MTTIGFHLFDTAVGACAIAWAARITRTGCPIRTSPPSAAASRRLPDARGASDGSDRRSTASLPSLRRRERPLDTPVDLDWSPFPAHTRDRPRDSTGRDAHLWRNRETPGRSVAGARGRSGARSEPDPHPDPLPPRPRGERTDRRLLGARRRIDQAAAPGDRGRRSPRDPHAVRRTGELKQAGSRLRRARRAPGLGRRAFRRRARGPRPRRDRSPSYRARSRSHRRGDGPLPAVDADRLRAQAFQDALGAPPGRVGLRSRHQQRELVAAPPRREVPGALELLEDAADVPQGGAAEGVPELVVHPLQLIHVENQQRQRLARPRGVLDGAGVVAPKGIGVREAG